MVVQASREQGDRRSDNRKLAEKCRVSCRISCKVVSSRKKKTRQNLKCWRAFCCRGDWIRTSDLLNPILWVKVAPSRRIPQMQAFWRLTDFILHTLYADHSGKSTICPHFPGFSLPKPARENCRPCRIKDYLALLTAVKRQSFE